MRWPPVLLSFRFYCGPHHISAHQQRPSSNQMEPASALSLLSATKFGDRNTRPSAISSIRSSNKIIQMGYRWRQTTIRHCKDVYNIRREREKKNEEKIYKLIRFILSGFQRIRNLDFSRMASGEKTENRAWDVFVKWAWKRDEDKMAIAKWRERNA